MPPTPLFDNQGQPIQLGSQLGVGGEGAVSDIVGAPDRVAKVYHKVRPERADKLRVMAAMASPALQQVAAWPLTTLHDRPNGNVVGLVMQKVSHWRELHFLYNVAARRIHYPDRDWRFLLTAAYNCAAAFDEIHKARVVVGDVNQSNILVSDQAGIFFIDCDSFQIQQNGKTYFCEVGVDLFTPPELQGQSFANVVRTPNHDLFGLAVIVFHLLFMGRHPFSGRFTGQGDMPIDRAIREHRFAYGPGASSYQMSPPPKALTLDTIPPALATLFVRAFDRGATSRPAAGEWAAAIQTTLKDIQRCPAHPGHYHAASAGCPWCRLAQQGAPDFFITVVAVPTGLGGPVFVLATAWASIEQVARPKFTPTKPLIPAVKPTPWPANVATVAPPKLVRPAILSKPPQQPPSQVPMPTIPKVAVPPSRMQEVARRIIILSGNLTALSFCAFFLLVLSCIVFRGTGWLLATAGLVGIVSLGVMFVSAQWWGRQELGRREAEAKANEGYFAAQLAYQNAVTAERNAWQRRVDAERAVVQQEYDKKTRDWDAIIGPMKAEADRRRKAKTRAEKELPAAEKEWQDAVARILRDFDETKAVLKKTRTNYTKLDAEYQAEWLKLQGRAKELQMHLYLDGHLIEDAQIEKIGAGRKATLASFGIETALDIDASQIQGVIPGFGPALTGNLVAWRRSLEKAFVFFPTKGANGVPLQDQKALQQKYVSLKAPLEASLRSGAEQLQGIISRGNTELQKIGGTISQKAHQAAQTNADLQAIPPGV